MTTTLLYLLRHGATDANLATPNWLQGRGRDLPLRPEGIRQAEATRDLLATRKIDKCFTSPMLRAAQTAAIIAQAHGLTPEPVDALIECDVGRWEGLDWDTIRRQEPEAYRRFMAEPGDFGYPGGETFASVHERAREALENLLTRHAGLHLVVVGHHVVNRTYLAGLLGLGPNQARAIVLDNCGVSIVAREKTKTRVLTLNSSFHLPGV